MGNCLVTKLNSVVDNDNLRYFGWMAVKLNSFKSGANLITLRGFDGNLPLWKVIEGDVYRNSDFTNKCENGVEYNGGAANYNLYIQNNNTAKILVNIDNINFINKMADVQVSSNALDSAIAAIYIDLSDMAYSTLKRIDITRMYAISREKPENYTIEHFIEKKFDYCKKLGTRPFDNAVTDIPCVRNAIDTGWNTTLVPTFNGAVPRQKTIGFSFDYDNNIINVYDTLTNVSDVYTWSNVVATFNATTKVWTYNQQA